MSQAFMPPMKSLPRGTVIESDSKFVQLICKGDHLYGTSELLALDERGDTWVERYDITEGKHYWVKRSSERRTS